MDFPFASHLRQSKREVVVEIATELLQAIITKGWCVGGLECVQGLPKTAKFERLWVGRSGDTICLVFSDNSFSPTPPLGETPYIRANSKTTYAEMD